MSLNEIAYAHWQLAMQWMEVADDAEDTNTTICYTGLAEVALKAAQFAVNNPALVAGLDDDDWVARMVNQGVIPAGEVQIPGVPSNPVVPQGPEGGPRLWGAPTP